MSAFWNKISSGYNRLRLSKLSKGTTTGIVGFIVLFTGLAQGSQVGYCARNSLTNWNKNNNNNNNNANMSATKRIPCAFIPHGGGPLPILGDEFHVDMVNWLNKFAETYLSGNNKPKSVLVISAHWEEKVATVQSGETTKLYYDYYGFPEESYNLDYNLIGATDLSKRVVELLESANIPLKVNDKRGYDHGVFIPMKIIYPEGDIPTIQLSLVAGLDPATHIKIGEALAPLRDEGVFILGSGMSYHNMRGFRGSKSNLDSEPFHEYLRNSLIKSKTYEERTAALEKWASAPKARDCHPREEHLIPIHVILGASKNDDDCNVKEEFFANVAGVKCAGYVFQ